MKTVGRKLNKAQRAAQKWKLRPSVRREAFSMPAAALCRAREKFLKHMCGTPHPFHALLQSAFTAWHANAQRFAQGHFHRWAGSGITTGTVRKDDWRLYSSLRAIFPCSANKLTCKLELHCGAFSSQFNAFPTMENEEGSQSCLLPPVSLSMNAACSMEVNYITMGYTYGHRHMTTSFRAGHGFVPRGLGRTPSSFRQTSWQPLDIRA